MTLKDFLDSWNDDLPTIRVFTSGSTGKPKPLLVEKRRMVNSARMTCRFLGLHEGDTALLCMPLDYIAGKMMVVRAVVGNLHLLSVAPSGHPLQGVSVHQKIDLGAMVPLQVYNSLMVGSEREKLKSIRHLIIGGGALDEKIEAQLKAFPNNVWCSYGMTETLSHVAMRKINGPDASPWYEPLENVHVGQNENGCLVVSAPDLCDGDVVTHDVVEMNPDGKRFMVKGRIDNVIDCGGVKMLAEEVEQLLAPHLVMPFYIARQSDEKFGEIPVLVIEKGQPNIEEIIKGCLPKYWRPKRIVVVDDLPLTENGKPRRNVIPEEM